MRSSRILLACVSLLCGACGDDTSAPATTPPPSGPRDGLPASCNPLRAEGACLMPFPSAVFLDPDDSSATGSRLALSAEVMPVSDQGDAYEPKTFEGADGFSPSAEILAYFPERVDSATLPSITDPSQSLDASASGTIVVDMDGGELVAHFSEVDAQVRDETERQALIIRPVARLQGGKRYAVAITNEARSIAGAVLASPPGWAAIASGDPARAPEGLARKQAARMPEIFGALEAAGVPRDRVVLAWDFVTASDDGLVRTMRAVRDLTLAAIGETGLGYTITSIEEDFSADALRRVKGTFKAPRFLTNVDTSVAKTELVVGDDGLPVQDGELDAPFTLIVPRSAETGQVRLLVFGHGFLGSAESEMGDADGSHVQQFANDHGYALVGTDWMGLSAYEGTASDGSGAAVQAVEDMNKMPWVSHRLHQALANAMTLARTAREAIAKDPTLFVGGAQAIDDSRVDYYGISLGGVLGSALMGWSPDLERGVLNVGAAGWTAMLQRSTNWVLFKLFLDAAYPDKLDQQIWIEVFAAHADPTDGMSIAPHVIDDPLPGAQPKQVLLQMALNDAQVPNLATENLARTLGLGLLSDSPKAVWGLETGRGPLSSALTVWDTKETDIPPLTNTTASATTMNDTHGEIRQLPALQQQIDAFLRTGEVLSTCRGPCDPE